MREIPLMRRHLQVAVAIVDDADFEALSQFRWRPNGTGYAVRYGDNTMYLMHREILGLTPGDGFEVDHINRNKVDNRRENIRAVTRAQNKQNLVAYRGSTSPFRGVSWSKRRRLWVAQVKVAGKQNYLGCFGDEREAAAVAAAFRAENMPYAVER